MTKKFDAPHSQNGATSLSLIDALADDLRPVRVVRASRKVVSASVFIVLYILVAIVALKPRTEFASEISDWAYRLEILGGFLFWGGAYAYAVAASLPGRSGRRSARWLPTAAMIIGAVFLGAGLFGVNPAFSASEHFRIGLDPAGRACAFSVLAVAVIPLVLSVLGMRRLAPIQPRRVAAALAIAAGFSGATVLAVHCPVDEWLHIAVWHLGPVLALAILGFASGWKLLRW